MSAAPAPFRPWVATRVVAWFEDSGGHYMRVRTRLVEDPAEDKAARTWSGDLEHGADTEWLVNVDRLGGRFRAWVLRYAGVNWEEGRRAARSAGIGWVAARRAAIDAAPRRRAAGGAR